MNIDSFLDRWRGYGPSKQLAVLLAVLTKRTDAGELRIPMSEIDDISSGETVVYMENARANEIILRFSPEYTTLYTIEETLHERKPVAQWPSPSQASTTSEASSASHKTDSELAEMEERQQRASSLREQARGVRGVPMHSGPPKGKSRPPARPLQVDEVQ
jgi:hypothetical protein